MESTRIIGDQTTTKCRGYLASFTELGRFAETVRGYWATENSQHWVSDVQFREDAHRSKDYLAANLALVRRMALNVIRHNGPSRHSLRIRKLRASLSDDYRFELSLEGLLHSAIALPITLGWSNTPAVSSVMAYLSFVLKCDLDNLISAGHTTFPQASPYTGFRYISTGSCLHF